MPLSKRRFAVYRNLNNGQLSIKSVKTGLVIGHCQRIILAEAVFSVNERGVKRIRKQQRKEVVAMVVGSIIELDGFVSYKGRSHGPYLLGTPTDLSDRIKFDPYKWMGFVNDRHEIVSARNYVEINKNGMMIASLR